LITDLYPPCQSTFFGREIWKNVGGTMATIADAGPGPLVVPLGGSVILGGTFLALAVITGGLWLVRRSKGPTGGAGAGKAFLVSLGAAACCGTLFLAILGLFFPPFWLGALVLLALGVFLIITGCRSHRQEVMPTVPLEQASFADKPVESIQENTRPSNG
jgi:hypothetical protein